MIDTLRTAGIGIAGSALHWTEYIPPIMSALAALATSNRGRVAPILTMIGTW